MINRMQKGVAILLAVVMITAALTVVSITTAYAAADSGGRVPYQYAFEQILSDRFDDTRMGVLRNRHLPLGQTLTADGWLATAEGVTRYQYLWLPVGEQAGEWQDVTTQRITARSDLSAAHIPYASGHSTAGFRLTIDPPSDATEGYYNVYIRGVDGMGVPCDLVALLNLRYGDPDRDDGKKYGISFPRVLREGEGALAGDATVTAEGIVLGEDGRVRLGDLNLTAFEQLRITYTVAEENGGVEEGRRAVLGLKSSGDHSYGAAGDPYDLTDNVLYAALPAQGEGGVLEMDLSDVTHSGELWLTGYLGCRVTVTDIELTYNGYGTDRVAAKIYLSEDLVSEYFGGSNSTVAKGVKDPLLGDVLRLEVSQDTNDPYIHFDAGALLGEYEINLDADEYKYMVLLYRAETCNNGQYMNLYLCSGNITGATEDCNQGVKLKKDGNWHYLLVDLSQKANWGGIINGWRFDYISSDSDQGDAVEFATVQFFRTYEAARTAASREIAKQQPYHCGDPAVIRDMSEEGGSEGDDFVIPSEDSYVGSETVTEATTEMLEETTEEALTEPVESGCGSVVAMGWMVILPRVGVALLRKKD